MEHICPGMAHALGEDDIPVRYSPKWREWAIQFRSEPNAVVLIEFCPWCGEKLPASLRDAWFDRLEELGILSPHDPSIPAQMLSDEWWMISDRG